MDVTTLIELFSVAFSLVFIILVMQENIWCWPFGIAGSALSVALFLMVDLNAESVLYFFYVVMGFYGWWSWRKNEIGSEIQISRWSNRSHLTLIGVCLITGVGAGWIFETYTDAAYPYIDSQTTVFGIAATFLEARKKLFAWTYWIILNGASIALYASRELYIYSALMVLYFVLSILGQRSWRARYKLVND